MHIMRLPLMTGARRLSPRRPDDIYAGPAVGSAPDVVSHGLLTPADGARRPPRHVRRHDDIWQRMEGERRREDIWLFRRWIAIPSIDNRASDATVLQCVIERALVDVRSASYIEHDGRSAHRRKGCGVDDAGRLGGQRYRDHEEIGRGPEVAKIVQRKRAIDDGGRRHYASVGDVYFHLEGLCPHGNGFADMSVAEEPDRLFGEFVVQSCQ